jgi:hypothetical protein
MTAHVFGAASRTSLVPESDQQIRVLSPMARRGRRAYRRPMPIARLAPPSVTVAEVIR